MERPKLTCFVIVGLLCTSICARPGQLKQQKFEFEEFNTSSSQASEISTFHNERLQAAPYHQETTLWSQQHPNEVNAFAEMFRQNYNQMVTQHNQMMEMQQQTMSNVFIPVPYQLFHIPPEYTWSTYFGNQHQFVYDETARMSRQLIEDIEQGRHTQEELMSPFFFIEQAATELNRLHQPHQTMENSYQQSSFVEPAQQSDLQHSDDVVAYNDKTQQYEHVELQNNFQVPALERPASSMDAQRPSYIQSLPPVRFENDKLHGIDRQIDRIEIHTPVSVEMSRMKFASTVKPLNYQSTQINDDEFYGSTYDQQPKFDLRFAESTSTATTAFKSHVMSLVRNRPKASALVTTAAPTTTTTTTPLPTTTSGIMSMLPHKRPAMNYTDLYQQVQKELDKQLRQLADNKTGEVHFMGMTSNGDHGKLTYETVNHSEIEKVSRGDQGATMDDYIYDESNEKTTTETHNYPTSSQPTLIVQAPVTSVLSTTSSSVRSKPLYSASLATFPTTTTTSKPGNPYYSAPLAPFPQEVTRTLDDTQHLQFAEYSEVSDMNQHVETMEHNYNDYYVEPVVTIQNLDDRLEFEQGQFHVFHGYVGMQQFEDVQQRYTGVDNQQNMGQSLQDPVFQKHAKQLPPEQAYRNPDLQHTSDKAGQHEQEIAAHVQEVTVPSVSINVTTPKKSWIQRQVDKAKSLFH